MTARAAVAAPASAPHRRSVSVLLESDDLAFVGAGDWVDVLATLKKPGADGRTEDVTLTLLQRVAVLDVRKSETAEGKSVLSLSLSPEEAQALVLASASGRLRVALRSPEDVDTHPMQEASLRRAFSFGRGDP